jgi:protocatechuate 3,4-dioxygenase beta subunit
MNTDSIGVYAFQTILPGRYLNGGTYRPRHIHFRVSHPGFTLLTTQLYFAGDPFLDSDPFMHPSLVIPLEERQDGWHGRFDIVLAR